MCLKKVFAVGLTVLAGMAGVVSAANSPIADPELATPPTGKMDVSYEVKLDASMVVTPKTLKDNALFVNVGATPFPNSYAGNLGDIVVKTNYPRWDVEVEAMNKLVLSLPGTPNPGSPPLIPPSTDPGKSLLATPAPDNDKAMLDVWVGIVTGAATVYTATNTQLTTELSSSGKTSFALAMGDITANVPTNAGFAIEPWSDVKTGGFGQQTDPTTGVQFFVSAGLINGTDKTPLTEITGKNTNGVYTETLTFTLIAGF